MAPGQRTVTAVLRVMGFGRECCFHKYHRVLSHTRWLVLAAGRLLLGELLAVLAPTGPVVMGLDDTIERWWGEQIATRGIYCDSVRSSRGHFVKTNDGCFNSNAPALPGDGYFDLFISLMAIAQQVSR